jgi:DHA1 family multidrug resistance protein-like MFS transporter
LSDRLGRKPMIVGGTALYAVATALFLTTTDPYWFILFRLVEGIGAAAVVPAGQALVADLTSDRDRSRAYGWLTTAQFGGMIVGPAIALPLYQLGGGGVGGFSAIFVFGAALTAATAVVLAALLREPARHAAAVRDIGRASREGAARHEQTERATGAAPAHVPLRELLTRPVLAIILVVAAAEFAFGAWEVVWSIWLRHLGAPLSFVGITWVAFSVPMLFSFAGGMLADRFSRFVLMTGGFALMATSFTAVGLTRDLTVYLALMVAGGVAFALAFPAKQAFLVQVTPQPRLGTVQGIEQTAMQASALVGTLTAPLLYEAIGGAVFVVGGGVALAGLAIAAPVLRREWRCVSGGDGVRSCAQLRRAREDASPDLA